MQYGHKVKYEFDDENKCRKYLSESWISNINLSKFINNKRWKVSKTKNKRPPDLEYDVVLIQYLFD